MWFIDVYTLRVVVVEFCVFSVSFTAGIFLLAMLAVQHDKFALFPVLPLLPVPLRRDPLLYQLPYVPGLAFNMRQFGK